MTRKGIKYKHKHKGKKQSENNSKFAPVLILAVPVAYLIVILLGALNQLIG